MHDKLNKVNDCIVIPWKQGVFIPCPYFDDESDCGQDFDLSSEQRYILYGVALEVVNCCIIKNLATFDKINPNNSLAVSKYSCYIKNILMFLFPYYYNKFSITQFNYIVFIVLCFMYKEQEFYFDTERIFIPKILSNEFYLDILFSQK